MNFIKNIKTFLSVVNFLFYVIVFSRNNKISFLWSDSLDTFFVNNDRLKLAKNQAKPKQHPDAELLLLGNYLVSLSTLSFKNNKTF